MLVKIYLYKTMTIEEGMNLDVKEISEKDAFLFFGYK